MPLSETDSILNQRKEKIMGHAIDFAAFAERKKFESEALEARKEMADFREAWRLINNLPTPKIVRLFRRALRLRLITMANIQSDTTEP